MKEYMDQLRQELEAKFIAIEEASVNDLQQAAQCIKAVTKTISSVKEYLAEHPPSQSEQVIYFKHYAPAFYQWLVYYSERYRLVMNLPLHGRGLTAEMLTSEIKKAELFLIEHSELRRYITSGSDYLDRLYFVRDSSNSMYHPDAYSFLIADCGAVTPVSFRVAHIKATELFLAYLESELDELNGSVVSPKKVSRTGLTWTGSNTDFVEFVYGVYHSKCVNNGQAEISTIANIVGQMFNRSVKAPYKTWREILDRKNDKERAVFLRRMVKNTEDAMGRADERPSRF